MKTQQYCFTEADENIDQTLQKEPLQVSIGFFTSYVYFLRENAKYCMLLSPLLYVYSLQGENDLFASGRIFTHREKLNYMYVSDIKY